MLNLRKPEQLARLLRTTVRRMCAVLRRAEDYCEELLLLDPRKMDKPRPVVSPRGPLRAWQKVFQSAALVPSLTRSPHSHGGVPGRSVLTNVKPHLGSAFVFTADIASFYPSIRRDRVSGLFRSLGCAGDVADLCTRLCTFRHRLEQGLITSPALADQLMRPVDARLAGICRELGLVYTRFVDDLAVSGSFDLEASGVPALVHRILAEHGFRANPDKDPFGAVGKGAAVTRLRFPDGHPDVARAYADELDRQLADAARLAKGDVFDGPYFTESQIRGRVQFVGWVNPGRLRRLRSLLSIIDWNRARVEARHRGLEAVVKRVAPLNEFLTAV